MKRYAFVFLFSLLTAAPSFAEFGCAAQFETSFNIFTFLKVGFSNTYMSFRQPKNTLVKVGDSVCLFHVTGIKAGCAKVVSITNAGVFNIQMNTALDSQLISNLAMAKWGSPVMYLAETKQSVVMKRDLIAIPNSNTFVSGPKNALLPFQDGFAACNYLWSDATPATGRQISYGYGKFIGAGEGQTNLNGVRLLNSSSSLYVNTFQSRIKVQAGIMSRVSGLNGYYLALQNNMGDYSVVLYKRVAGVASVLRTVRAPSYAGTIGMDIVGNLITVKFNGATLFSLSDSAIPAAGGHAVRGTAGVAFVNYGVR